MVSQTVEGLPEGEQRQHPPPQYIATEDTCDDATNVGSAQDKFLLHPDDPHNFLKLCTALRILVCRRLTTEDIDHAEDIIREYCKELILVGLLPTFLVCYLIYVEHSSIVMDCHASYRLSTDF